MKKGNIRKVIINVFFLFKTKLNFKKRLETNVFLEKNTVIETRGCQTCVVGQWNSSSAVKLIHCNVEAEQQRLVPVEYTFNMCEWDGNTHRSII